jgi:PAS domain S-box-containing protein
MSKKQTYEDLEELTKELEKTKLRLKKTEKSLRDSEARLNSFLDYSPVGIGLWDREFRYVYINDVLCKINGLSLEEHIGHTIEEVLPKAAHIIRPLFESILSSCKPALNIELSGIVPSCPEKNTHYLVSYFPVSIIDGTPLYIGGVIFDITDRKKAELDLIETAITLKEAQKFAKIGSWQYDPVTQMPSWTEEMFHIFGLEPRPEALPYEEHRKIIHPDDWDRFDAAVSRAVTEGVGYDLELRITHPDGALIYANARCEAKKNELGEVIRLIGTTQDITDRKLAENDLKISEKNYRTLFKNMAQGAFYQSSDGKLFNVNSAALEMFGLTYDQFVGKTSKDPQWKVVHEDGTDFPAEEHPSMVSLKTGKACRDIVAGIYNVKKNGYTWVTINSIPQFNEGEEQPYQVFVTLHDITARKQSEDLLLMQHDLSIKLSHTNKFDEGLKICLDSALNASNMDGGAIYLFDENTEDLNLIFHVGLSDDFVSNTSRYEKNSLNANLIMKGQPVYANHHDLGLNLTDSEKKETLKALAIIPIKFQDQVLGCLNIASKSKATVPESTRIILETITNQMGGAIAHLRTRKILIDSETRFNLAMNAAKDGLYDWNLETNEIYYSPGWKQMLGYEVNELSDDLSVWEKLIDPKDVKRFWEMQQDLLKKNIDQFELEFKMKHKDGHWVDILSRAKAIFDNYGKANRIVGTHVNITERKKAEIQLKDILQFNEKIISESPVGI